MSVVMCKRCARAVKYAPRNHDAIPETHADVDTDCPRPYAE